MPASTVTATLSLVMTSCGWTSTTCSRMSTLMSRLTNGMTQRSPESTVFSYRPRNSTRPFSKGRTTRNPVAATRMARSEEHTSELQSRENLVCRLLLEKKKELSCRTNTPVLRVYRFSVPTPPTAIYTLPLHDALPIFPHVDFDEPLDERHDPAEPGVHRLLVSTEELDQALFERPYDSESGGGDQDGQIGRAHV